MFSWWVLLAIIASIAVVAILVGRSSRKWRQPAATSEEARQAEARLWSTRGSGSGGQ